jgi:ubiquinone/menaquinone biosynthesis C-methylase UbiE
MPKHAYFMESDDEALRLDMKTDGAVVENQARWAGIRQGMRVADMGCGSGKTTHHLNQLAQPGGETIGIDFSEQRIAYAQDHYRQTGLSFCLRDIREPLADLGTFDFIWIRFVLEYYRAECTDLLRNISRLLRPGGILCVIDLDYNCLVHYGLSSRLERAISAVVDTIEQDYDFDPYIGRKLYAYLYDLGLEGIQVMLQAHNLIYGTPEEKDLFNWQQKMTLANRFPDEFFGEYAGGRDAFLTELNRYISDPRRFTYTPVISCRGIKPEERQGSSAAAQD